jgi:hypothetical protein
MNKDASDDTRKPPKREQRERYAVDEQRRLQAALGPKPFRKRILDWFRKEQSNKGK